MKPTVHCNTPYLRHLPACGAKLQFEIAIVGQTLDHAFDFRSCTSGNLIRSIHPSFSLHLLSSSESKLSFREIWQRCLPINRTLKSRTLDQGVFLKAASIRTEQLLAYHKSTKIISSYSLSIYIDDDDTSNTCFPVNSTLQSRTLDQSILKRVRQFIGGRNM
jgi:hypothetical protein